MGNKSSTFDILHEKARSAPNRPGVYIWYDKQGMKIYVGKARSLRKRLLSYFSKTASERVQALMKEARDLDYEVLDSEDDALRRERELIPSRQEQEMGAPKTKYNITWHDDKSWPYLKITIQDDFPRLLIVRDKDEDGSLYFGRKTRVGAVRRSLKTIRRLFPVCVCYHPHLRKRPCLDYQLGLCSAPCCGKISQEEYRKIVDELVLFLRGERTDLVDSLYVRMEDAAQELEFEKAADLRNKIQLLEKAIGEQKRASLQRDKDLIAFSRDDGHFGVLARHLRENKAVGSFRAFVEGISHLSDEDILSSFFHQFYLESDFVPMEIITPVLPSDLDNLGVWLTKKKGSEVIINTQILFDEEITWQRAKKEIEIATRVRKESLERESNTLAAALEGLQEVLDLPTLPRRMECYDISNIQGSDPVGSQVVFVDGVPKKSEYRHYRIKTVEGINDVASMREVLSRRLRSTDSDSPTIPDLIVVDGGKGQLNAARAVLQERNLEAAIELIGLAKRLETIHRVKDEPDTITIANDSPILFLLQRIRDEAHRFAISYHRLLRSKRMRHSILDEIPGIGEKRRKALLEQFPDTQSLKNASVTELAGVPGISQKLAEIIHTHLRFAGSKSQEKLG
ncbi:MAG: excinuclease ABC subunit UvrC [Candidatus Hodarchaeales archaeon]